jgi:hypothetical protein
MQIPLTKLSTGAIALTVFGGFAFSQEIPPPPTDATATSQAALYDPRQFPAIRGDLERLTLTARGDIDGFILKDGTEVKTAPGLSTQIAFAIKPGDRITVHGLRAAALPLVRAVSITDEVTHRTVADSEMSDAPPPHPARPPRGNPPPPAGINTETSGRVGMVLHGAQGEVNGVLLESGTILRFPPDQTAQLISFLQPRQPLVAEGVALTNAMGTVVDVQQVGPSRDRLVDVGPPSPPMEDRGPAGSQRRPPPLDRAAPLPPPPPPPPAS